MKSGTCDCLFCFPSVMFVLELQLHCSLDTQILSWSTHNGTLHFQHLNLFLVCFVRNTHNTAFICSFEASYHYFAL